MVKDSATRYDINYKGDNGWRYKLEFYKLVEKEGSFSLLHLWRFEKRETVPLLLDWAAGDRKCKKAKKSAGYACQASKSECFDSVNGTGYNCKCSSGYEGNPYLPDGCQGNKLML